MKLVPAIFIDGDDWIQSLLFIRREPRNYVHHTDMYWMALVPADQKTESTTNTIPSTSRKFYGLQDADI